MLLQDLSKRIRKLAAEAAAAVQPALGRLGWAVRLIEPASVEAAALLRRAGQAAEEAAATERAWPATTAVTLICSAAAASPCARVYEEEDLAGRQAGSPGELAEALITFCLLDRYAQLVALPAKPRAIRAELDALGSELPRLLPHAL